MTGTAISKRFGPHACRPRVGVDGVDPQRLEPQADGGDPETADGTEEDRPLEKRCQRQQFDHDRGTEIQREPVDRGAEYRADQQSDDHRADAIASNAAMMAAPRPIIIRAATRPNAARGRDQHRLEDLAELRHAEVELDLEDRHADDDAPEREVLDELETRAVLGRIVADGLASLVIQEQRGQRRETGAADHHQVGGTPQRDVLTEDAVPDVVEGEARQCVQPAARPSAIPPTGAYQFVVIRTAYGPGFS